MYRRAVVSVGEWKNTYNFSIIPVEGRAEGRLELPYLHPPGLIIMDTLKHVCIIIYIS